MGNTNQTLGRWDTYTSYIQPPTESIDFSSCLDTASWLLLYDFPIALSVYFVHPIFCIGVHTDHMSMGTALSGLGVCMCMLVAACVCVCVCQEHNFSADSYMAPFTFAKQPQWVVLHASLVCSYSYCEATLSSHILESFRHFFFKIYLIINHCIQKYITHVAMYEGFGGSVAKFALWDQLTCTPLILPNISCKDVHSSGILGCLV